MHCTEPEGGHDIPVQLRPVKTSFLALSSHHPALIPSPPSDTPSAPLGMALSLGLLLCTSTTRPLNPKLSLSLCHTQKPFSGQLGQGFGVLDNFYPDGVKEIMGYGNWLHIAPLWLLPLGMGGPALDQRSRITPETYRTAAASVPKEHLSVSGPCSAQAETEQM